MAIDDDPALIPPARTMIGGGSGEAGMMHRRVYHQRLKKTHAKL
jgi:hypothetical protein